SAGIALYQVGRNSLSQPKKAAASKPGVQTTLEPADNAARTPVISPSPWNRGNTLSKRSRGSRARGAPTLRATRQTLACVSGTILGREVVPEVTRMNASSALNASSGLCALQPTMPAAAGPTMLNPPGPSPRRGDRSMTGMPRPRATARLAESTSGDVNSADTCKSSKYRRHSSAVKDGLSGTQTAAIATAIIATAASASFGNTTATRSLRPGPRLCIL